jgi:hypothetical protein
MALPDSPFVFEFFTQLEAFHLDLSLPLVLQDRLVRSTMYWWTRSPIRKVGRAVARWATWTRCSTFPKMGEVALNVAGRATAERVYQAISVTMTTLTMCSEQVSDLTFLSEWPDRCRCKTWLDEFSKREKRDLLVFFSTRQV